MATTFDIAFPQQFTIPPGGNMPDGSVNKGPQSQVFIFTGLTTRQYMASRAMQGLLANTLTNATPEQVAAQAVAHADALLVKLAQ